MLRGSCLVVFLLLVSVSGVADAQPSLSYASPGALRPGQATEFSLHGAKLDDPLSIWTSFPATVELLPGSEENKDQTVRKCKITVDAGAPVSVGGIVAGTASGASDVLLVMLDDLPSVAEAADHHSPQSAQAIEIPAAVDGAADGSRFDYYKFAAQAGQRVAVEVVAARVGSALDPVVRLLDAAGSELLLADDDESLGADCRFAYTCEREGEYVLEVRDNQYRSGGRYRLRIGDFPLVSVPYPLGGRLGSTARFQFVGPAAEDAVPVFLRIPEAETFGGVAISAKREGGVSSGMTVLAATRLPELRETEPNDAQKTASPLTLPCAVNGILQAEGDRDYYVFAATKDQPFEFRAVSRSLGSPSVLFMRLYDSDGKALAETQVNESSEFTLAHTFAADGMYCLLVHDLLRRGGPEHAYRVEIEPNVGFALSLKNDKDTKLQFLSARGNGAFGVEVQIARRGYEGPIEFSLEGTCTKCRLVNSVAPAGSKAHKLVIAAAADAQPGDLQVLRLVGSAPIGGRTVESFVQTKAIVHSRRPQLAYPPAWVDGLLSVAVGGEAQPFFGTQLESPSIPLAADSGQAEFTVSLERKNEEFKEGILVVLEGLPEGFSYSVKQDKDNYRVTVNGPPGAAAAQHPFRIVSFGELKGNGLIIISEATLQTEAASAGS